MPTRPRGHVPAGFLMVSCHIINHNEGPVPAGFLMVSLSHSAHDEGHLLVNLSGQHVHF